MSRKILKPPRLRPGDTVAIISPSNPIDSRSRLIEKECDNFEQLTGLKTKLAPNAMASHFYSAGTAQQRLDDLHWAFDDDTIKGVICSGGGCSAIDMVERIDYDLIARKPKVLAGLSDATTLFTPVNCKTGLVCFHGIELLDFSGEPMSYNVESIQDVLMSDRAVEYQPNTNWRDLYDTKTRYQGWQTIRAGQADGKLVGGNQSSFSAFLGTEYKCFDEKSILVLESYMNIKKYIHRAMMWLRVHKVFDQISGLVVGYFVGSDEPDVTGNDRPLADILLEATDGYDFPIMQVGEIGHCVENLILPIGANGKMNADDLTFGLIEPAVV